MHSIFRILLDIVIFGAIVFAGVYLYRTYSDAIWDFLDPDSSVVVFIGEIAVSARIADDPEERQQGLSGTESLGELEAKLFVFDAEGYHDMWMKDMNYPIDIIFINNQFRVVDIAENVLPESYPLTYTSSRPARFVLETNAYFARTFSVNEGDYVTIPPRYLPKDLRESLRK